MKNTQKDGRITSTLGKMDYGQPFALEDERGARPPQKTCLRHRRTRCRTRQAGDASGYVTHLGILATTAGPFRPPRHKRDYQATRNTLAVYGADMSDRLAVIAQSIAFMLEYRNGCCLHIVVADDNIDDDAVRFCIGYAAEKNHKTCEWVAEELLDMDEDQRAAIIEEAGRL